MSDGITESRRGTYFDGKVGAEANYNLPLRDEKLEKEVEKIVNHLSKQNNPTEYPDAKLHQTVSFIKSGVRIIGYAALPFSLGWAVTFLILSEGIGIIEELV